VPQCRTVQIQAKKRAERPVMKSTKGKPKMGRPVTGRGRGSPALYVRLTDDERDAVDRFCDRGGFTYAQLVRQRLQDILVPLPPKLR
jgi:hypothetical protein